METTRPRVLPDLAGLLPQGVWPTPLRVLECNSRFLFIREYAVSDLTSPSWPSRWSLHERMWKRLAAKDAVSVLCVWGGLGDTQREKMMMFDARGMGPMQPADENQFRQAVRGWWREAEIWPA